MTIELLDSLFNLFMIFTIVFFLLSVCLFFVFDIKNVYLTLSKKAAKKDIQKMREEGFKSGKLIRSNSAFSVYSKMDKLSRTDEIKKVVEEEQKTEPLYVNNDSEYDDSSNETSLLLQDEVSNDVVVENIPKGKFNIIKHEKYIHTSEAI